MVGGYVILTKEPLTIGDNNIAKMYGSLEAATNRLTDLVSTGKPFLVELVDDKRRFSYWVEPSEISGTEMLMRSAVFDLSYNVANGILNVTVKQL